MATGSLYMPTTQVRYSRTTPSATEDTKPREGVEGLRLAEIKNREKSSKQYLAYTSVVQVHVATLNAYAIHLTPTHLIGSGEVVLMA